MRKQESGAAVSETKTDEEIAQNAAGAITAFINMRENSNFRLNSSEQSTIGDIIHRALRQKPAVKETDT